MWTASPRVRLLLRSLCGPLVSARQFGFEQRLATRAAVARITASTKASVILRPPAYSRRSAIASCVRLPGECVAGGSVEDQVRLTADTRSSAAQTMTLAVACWPGRSTHASNVFPPRHDCGWVVISHTPSATVKRSPTRRRAGRDQHIVVRRREREVRPPRPPPGPLPP